MIFLPPHTFGSNGIAFPLITSSNIPEFCIASCNNASNA